MSLQDEAEELMLHQYQSSPKLIALIRSLIAPFDDVDIQLNKLHRGRYIEDAKDATLDVMGAIVNQQRNGLSDEDYRPWLKVAICLNNSSGTPEELLRVLHILFDKTPPVTMTENPPNDVTFDLFELPKFPMETLMAIVRRAAPATTICHFGQAAPPPTRPSALSEINIAAETKSLSAFRFDHTTFSDEENPQYFFADFF